MVAQQNIGPMQLATNYPVRIGPVDFDGRRKSASIDELRIYDRELTPSEILKLCPDCPQHYFITRTWTAADQDGNTVSGSQKIEVIDTTAPVITAPTTVNVSTDIASCGAIVNYTATAIDNCGTVTLTYTQASGTFFPLGSTIVTVTAEDECGNIEQHDISINVTDNTAPLAVCQDITVHLDASGNASITAADVDGGSSDACGINLLSIDNSNFTCADAGANTVILTVTDINGNSSTCSATVTVIDSVAPIAVCQDITVHLDASGNAAITAADVDGGSTDACGINLLSIDNSNFTCTEAGANTVILTVTDINGNSSTCSATVTVIDSVAPIAVCQDITVHLDASGNASITAADVDGGSTDACGINLLSIDNSNFTCADAGANTVILTVTDINGNSSTCSATVTVIDSVAPIAVCQDITVHLDVSGNASITAADIDGGSTDTCGINLLSIDNSNFACADAGANTVILTVTDINGNSSTCSATVTVIDSVAPVAVCQDITVHLDASGNASITAADVDGGSSDACGVTLAINNSSFNCADVGANTVILTVTDINGNSSTCSATVTVIDSVAPIAVCQDITVHLDASGNAAITAADVDGGSTDACGINLLSIDNSNFTCTEAGANTVILTVTDINGNSSTCSATVTVIDSVAPIAVCQDITVHLDASGNASITAADVDGGSTDACGINLLSIDNSNFTCADAGANTVILSVTDINGNSSTCSATVTVIDSVAPIAVCQDITVHLDASGNASITAADIDGGSTDACGINLLSINNSNFTCADAGANTVILTVTDINGNSSTCSATVTVIDSVAPVAVCQDITVHLDASGNAAITAADVDGGSSDACGINLLSINNSNFTCADAGANTVILTVTDINGNSSTCSATVTVIDSVAPIAVCQDITVHLDASGNASITATDVDGGSSDACGINLLSIDNSNFTCADAGANTVILTVTDINGNSSTCSATVTVIDSVAPVAVCQDITVHLDASGNASITAADIDNGSADACGITLAINNSSFTCANIGTNTVTLTVTDNNGNSSTCTSTVTIEDNIAPIASCKDITVQLDASGNAIITAADIDNGSADACGVTLAINNSSFTCANVGANTVTLTVTDANGNVDTCSAVVTVEDNVVPSAIAQDITVQLDGSGNVSITPTDIDNGSTDACGVSLSISPSVFSCGDVGPNSVVLTVTDNNGNVSTDTATVTVQDTIAPVITNCPVDIVLNNTPSNCLSLTSWTPPTLDDNCGSGQVTLSYSAPGINIIDLTGVSIANFPVGTTTVYSYSN